MTRISCLTPTKRRTMAEHALDFLPEPSLLFRHNQPMADPREGIGLFGPLPPGGQDFRHQRQDCRTEFVAVQGGDA